MTHPLHKSWVRNSTRTKNSSLGSRSSLRNSVVPRRRVRWTTQVLMLQRHTGTDSDHRINHSKLLDFKQEQTNQTDDHRRPKKISSQISNRLPKHWGNSFRADLQKSRGVCSEDILQPIRRMELGATGGQARPERRDKPIRSDTHYGLAGLR